MPWSVLAAPGDVTEGGEFILEGGEGDDSLIGSVGTLKLESVRIPEEGAVLKLFTKESRWRGRQRERRGERKGFERRRRRRRKGGGIVLAEL